MTRQVKYPSNIELFPLKPCCNKVMSTIKAAAILGTMAMNFLI